MALMNALPLLGEIKQALRDLKEKGEPYIIYSNKLPTTLEDRYFLQDVLGKGELFMYEKVVHTKAVAFNTLIPGVWIELVFSDKDPHEPILEMVRIDYSPLSFTMQNEDLREGFEKFNSDVQAMKNRLTPFAFEVVKAFEGYLKDGKGRTLTDPEGLENLTYYLVTEAELIIENKSNGNEIVSTNYHGLWLERTKEQKPVAMHVGDFPHIFKPTPEDLEKGIALIEERKKHFLPKYEKRIDIPLM